MAETPHTHRTRPHDEVTALHQRLAALEADVAHQHTTLVDVQQLLDEASLENAELRQTLTEREEAQQAVEAERRQYQALFALAPDGYLVTDPRSLIHEANPAAARLLGMPPAFLRGKPLTGFVAPEEAQRFAQLLRALRTAQSTSAPWAGRFQPPRRPPFVGELTVTIRQERASGGGGYHWLLRDITARVEAEAAVRQALIERQRLEREAQQTAHFALLGRLAAGVSHELRNPLAAVVLHVELLSEELDHLSADSPAQMRDALTTIQAYLARVEDLLQDYLALVRVATLERTPEDIGALVQVWAKEWQPLAAVQGVTLHLEGVAGLGVVALHAHTLHRALLNLVQNALEAMPRGGILTLRGARTADVVALQLQDTGTGMPADALPRIFEPLYTTKPGGTGLGLYLVREILTAHEGQVTVESAQGQGTTVTLRLPVTTDDRA
jgi:PAS domain S-box-containing protein